MTQADIQNSASRHSSAFVEIGRAAILFALVQLVQLLAAGFLALAIGVFTMPDPSHAIVAAIALPIVGIAMLSAFAAYPLAAFIVALFNRFRYAALAHFAVSVAAFVLMLNILPREPPIHPMVASLIAYPTFFVGYLAFRWLAPVTPPGRSPLAQQRG